MLRISFRLAAVASVVAASSLISACGSDSSGSSPASPKSSDAAADVPPADASPTGASDAGQDAPPSPAVSCAAFCASVVKNCTGQNQQYASQAACMTLCGDLGPGTYGDSDNTVGCRQAHADRAASSPTECAAAGPFGAGVCGTRCDSFCMEIVDRCAGDAAVYSGIDACFQECGARYSFDTSKPELTDAGNTLNCREYWVSKTLGDGVAPADLTTDCQNAGPSSATCQ